MSLNRFAIRGAALTPSGAPRAAEGPLGCLPRKPASSSSSRNVLQKLSETLLERMCSPPSATQWSGFMQNMRMSFHIEENTAGRGNGKGHPEKGLEANKEAHQGNTKCSLSDGHLFKHTEKT